MTDLTLVLEPVVQTLAADGYEVDLTIDSGSVRFQITAGHGACEDCLSPPAVLTPIIRRLLQEAGYTEQLQLIYPYGWNGGSTAES